MGMKPSEPNEKLTDIPDGWDELELFLRTHNGHLSADAGRPILDARQLRDFSSQDIDPLLFRTVYDKFSAGLVSETEEDSSPAGQ